MTETHPRSAAEPMAFTGIEFFRGALAAWLWAMAVTTLAWTAATGGVTVTVVPFVVVPSVTAGVVVFAVLAWGLGRLLRRVRRTAIHALAFAALGAAIGVLTTMGWLASWTSSTLDWGPLYPVNAFCGALTVALGWRHAAAGALGWSRPRRAPAPPRSAVDAATEDEIADLFETRDRSR